MIRTIRKTYRIACIAFGRRRIQRLVLLTGLGILVIAYQNQFEISEIAADIMQILKRWNM